MFKWDKKKKKSSFNELNSLSNTSTPHSALLSRFDSFHKLTISQVIIHIYMEAHCQGLQPVGLFEVLTSEQKKFILQFCLLFANLYKQARLVESTYHKK